MTLSAWTVRTTVGACIEEFDFDGNKVMDQVMV